MYSAPRRRRNGQHPPAPQILAYSPMPTGFNYSAWSADGKRVVKMRGPIEHGRIWDGSTELTEFERGFASGVEYALTRTADDAAQATP